MGVRKRETERIERENHAFAKRLFDKQEARARSTPTPDPTESDEDSGAPDPDYVDEVADDFERVDFQSSLSEAQLTAFGATSGAEAKMAPASASRHLTPSPKSQDSFSGGGVAQR